MEEKFFQNKYFVYGVIMFLFALCQLWLNRCYPMTSDDLYYLYGVKLNSVGEIWNYSLNWGNGRVLGNFFGFFLVRHNTIRMFFKAFCMTLLYYLLIRVMDIRKKWVMVLGGVLLLFPGVKMYAQVYVWTIAWADYLIPVLLFLGGLRILQLWVGGGKMEKDRFRIFAVRNCRCGAIICGALYDILCIGIPYAFDYCHLPEKQKYLYIYSICNRKCFGRGGNVSCSQIVSE